MILGGTGSGKTTLLNNLSHFIPADERIITIEDAAELQLRQPHVIRLETRPPNIEGKGRVTIRDLLINALRMRPDRIAVGECRGGETLDVLQAMNTGHEGSLTTIHANNTREAVQRVETMVMMAGFFTFQTPASRKNRHPQPNRSPIGLHDTHAVTASLPRGAGRQPRDSFVHRPRKPRSRCSTYALERSPIPAHRNTLDARTHNRTPTKKALPGVDRSEIG